MAIVGAAAAMAGATAVAIAGAAAAFAAESADLGRKQSHYDGFYVEDKDNQIDIVLGGDERAVARITAVEIPARGRYSPFYNPGGPGSDPTPGVSYTAPGPSQTQPVLNALKDPMQVTFIR